MVVGGRKIPQGSFSFSQILIVSVWRSESDWQAHFEKDHTKNFFVRIKEFQENFENFAMDPKKMEEEEGQSEKAKGDKKED